MKRSVVLGTLASLTFAFLLGAAAYAYWNDVGQSFAEKVAAKSQLSAPAEEDSVLRPTVYEAGLPAVTGGQVQNASLTAAERATAEGAFEYKDAPVPALVQGDPEQEKSGFCIFSNRTVETPERYLLTHGQQDAAAAGDRAPVTTASQP